MLSALLAAHWATVFGEGRRPAAFEVVKHGGWRGSAAPVAFLVFTDGRPDPAYFLKVSRDEASAANIRREHEEYMKIYARAGRLQNCIPVVKWCGELGEYTILVESVVRGRSWEGVDFATARTRRGQRAISRLVLRALDWLLDFQGLTETRRVPLNRDFVDLHVARHVGRLSGEHREAMTALAPLLDQLVVSFEAHGPAQIPLVAVHGDYNHFNILVHGKELSVIDWEYCEAEGLPFVDPLFLLLETAIGSTREPAGIAVQAFVGPDAGSWSGALYRGAIDRLATAYGLDVRLVLSGMAASALGMLARDYRGTSFPLRSFETLELLLRAAVAAV